MPPTAHLPDAGKMMPTEHDYARDLAADLAIQQAATPGPWCAEDYICMPGDTPDCWHAYLAGEDEPPLLSASGSNARAEEDIRFSVAARECWHVATLRALAAEAAILEWADARRETLTEVDELRPPSGELLLRNERSRGALMALAARIRAGREKGAQL